VLTQSFADAVAEAEKIIVGAPHVLTEADLAEGYDYLAGNIRASLQLAWAYQRDFPYFVSSAGPYTKMGLDNPDALYFHSYLRDDAEYVVTGRRGTTTDLSFQVLDGDYSPVEVPGSLSAFDDRAIEIDGDGTFELRFGPGDPGRNYFPLGPGAAMLLVREVYSDWGTERRGTIGIHRADRAGCAPPVPEADTMAKRYRVAGKILLSRLRTFLAFPEWFYLKLPVNTMTEPRLTPGGLASQFSSADHYDLGDDQALMLPVSAQVPAAGLYSSAAVVPPPATRTCPPASSVAVWNTCWVTMLPVAVNVPAAGLYSSALVRVGVPPKAPPAMSTSPFCSSVAVSFVRTVLMLPVVVNVP
jgi:hypothetical protein